ncbi:hypothetical protein BD779DRAFT_1422805, partial [Infundibulicybe gibba]
RILAWIDIQHLYMPGLCIVRASDSAITPLSKAHHSRVEKIPLYLPSAAPQKSGCDSRL